MTGFPLTSSVSPAAKARPKVVAGQVRKVTAGLFEALADAGVVVVEKSQGSEVRLVGSTPSGKMFALLLRPVPTGGDWTEVAVQWGGQPDERLSRVVREALEAMRPQAEDRPEDAPPEPNGHSAK
jgi:hypothetical protein